MTNDEKEALDGALDETIGEVLVQLGVVQMNLAEAARLLLELSQPEGGGRA